MVCFLFLLQPLMQAVGMLESYKQFNYSLNFLVKHDCDRVCSGSSL